MAERRFIQGWDRAPASGEHQQADDDGGQQVRRCGFRIEGMEVARGTDGASLSWRDHERAHAELLEVARAAVDDGVDASPHLHEPERHGEACEEHEKARAEAHQRIAGLISFAEAGHEKALLAVAVCVRRPHGENSCGRPLLYSRH